MFIIEVFNMLPRLFLLKLFVFLKLKKHQIKGLAMGQEIFFRQSRKKTAGFCPKMY